MKIASLFALAATGMMCFAGNTHSTVRGDYLEVRSCDVYTGPCFANSEMGLTGREGMLFWKVRGGEWNGVKVGGLSVLAIIKTDGTLGNLKYQPRSGDAVLVVDAKANSTQREALVSMAREFSGHLIDKIVDVKALPIEAEMATCAKKGCASVKAGDLARISTSCLSAEHDVCGNEETFYPPLSPVQDALPVFTDLAIWSGTGLNVTWQISGKRCGFLGTFGGSALDHTHVAMR